MKIDPKKLNRVINLTILGLLALSLITLVSMIFMLADSFGNSTSRYTPNINVVNMLPTMANLSVTVMVGFYLARKRELLWFK